MEFRISDTFTDSLARLTGDEQKAVKTTAFDLQLDPANPGMQFHKLDKARDKNFWSVRVNTDIRLIVHRSNESLLLCYVDHHDKAYAWAERRKLEVHPKTGAAQIVQIRETVREITVPKYVEEEVVAPKKLRKLLFEDISEDKLLSYGVPPEWIDDVHNADEDTLFDLAEHLPAEAAEALLCLATGSEPAVIYAVALANPFEHPDALRRFRLMANAEELAQALEYPWEKWSVFLHPSQRDLVERNFNGPARVSGSAGTGKTVVAIHRAAYLAAGNMNARVLLTTFSEPLANSLKIKLRHLLGNRPSVLERIEVHGIGEVAERLYSARFGPPKLVNEGVLRAYLAEAASHADSHKFSTHFVWTEWNEIVDAWQIETWEAYRDVPRLGRKTRLGEAQRKVLWQIFSTVRSKLAEQELMTRADVFGRLTAAFHTAGNVPQVPYDYAIVDEAQDVGVPELRFLAALGQAKPDALFFAGDLGQRIFQPPFSWKSLGVDVRGRSRTLRINYRTSHQIRVQADRLLPPELHDMDGVSEERTGTISAFDGAQPSVHTFATEQAEIAAVATWLNQLIADGLMPDEIAVMVRSDAQFDRAKTAIAAAGLEPCTLDGNINSRAGCVAIITMHLAKGLEYRGVAVMACDDEVLPLQSRIEAVVDDSDLEEVYNTERHLLYVACTRARDQLLVTGVEPASEFLGDLVVVGEI